jgi:hypothetical protein
MYACVYVCCLLFVGRYVKSLSVAAVTARYIRWDFGGASSSEEGTAFLQLIAAGPSFDETPSTTYVVLVAVVLVGMLVVGALMWALSKTQIVQRRFYGAHSKEQIAKDNAEFSSDDSGDSDDDGGGDSDSSSSSSSDDPAVRKTKGRATQATKATKAKVNKLSNKRRSRTSSSSSSRAKREVV